MSNLGRYSITAWTNLTQENFRENDTLFGYSLYSSPVIAKFPYSEGFELSNGNWHGEKITGVIPWEWGTPSQVKINSAHSGNKVWMTGLSTNYPDFSQSYLQTPCFNFSGFSIPMLSFYMRLETEAKWDPMVVEASADQGVTWKRVDSANAGFYNSTASGGPFTPPYFSGSNVSWVKYTASLATFGNNSSITLRYRFLADGSTNDEGIAIDDVEIYAVNDFSMEDVFIPKDSICGDSNQSVYIVVKNNGKNTLLFVPYTIKISGPASATWNKTYPQIIAGKTDTILVGSFNAYAGGNLKFECYSRFTSDDHKGNDTIRKTIYIYPGIPVGGGIIPYNPFIGKIKNGTFINPDIACIYDTVTYKLQLPPGYSPAGYGKDWMITKFEFKTGRGYTPLDTMSLLPGKSGSDFVFRFVPHSMDADSLFKMKILFTSSHGCVLTYVRYLKAGENIYPGFIVNDVCFGDSSRFINKSIVSSSKLAYHWDFGNGDTSSLMNPVIFYKKADSFHVKLITEANSGCNDSISYMTQIHETPQAEFQATDQCRYDSAVFLNNTPSLKDTMYFLWDYGNGKKGLTYHGKSAYDTGQFNILLKANTKYGCKDSSAKIIRVYPNPVASFLVKDICLGDTMFLNNISSITGQDSLSFFWNLGMPDTSILKNPFIVPVKAGLVDILLTVTSNHGCLDSLSLSPMVYPLPDALFTVQDICLGDTMFLINQSGIINQDTLSFLWQLGSQDTSILSNPFIKPAQTGSVDIKLIVTSNHQCVDSKSYTALVNPLPVASFSYTPGTHGNVDFLPSDTNLISYIWLFGDNGGSISKKPMHQYKSDNDYIVHLWVQNQFLCDNIDSLTIHIIGAGLRDNNIFNDLKIYPNPFIDQLEISFSLVKPSTVKLCVCNLTGQRVIPSVEHYLQAGNIRQSLSLKHLAAGYYLIRLDAGENNIVNYGVIKTE
jgi:hypothetical protein